MQKNKGFTLIELLVVITIMGVLAAVGLSSYRVANQKARDSRRQADIQSIRSALEVYKSEEDTYIEGNSLSSLETYFSNDKVPVDPNSSLVDCPYEYVGLADSYTLTYCTELAIDGETSHTVNSPK